MSNIAFAFLLPFIAGLFTGVGGLIAIFKKNPDKNFLAMCISFSAGVMIYISFVEILHHSHESLEYAYGYDLGFALATLTFFGGIGFMAIIDKLIPHGEDIANTMALQSDLTSEKDKRALKRMGIMMAIAIAIHNFPEGLVTFTAAIHDPSLGIAIAIAIAIHNIPEGIAIAAPIHYATGSRKKALAYSALSGLTEPLGALVAFVFIMHVFNEAVLGFVFAAVGGIMVYISFKQLLPTAIRICKHGRVILALFAGMAVMAVSLIFI